MNAVSLVGNIARDPELRTTQSGLSVCTFTVACQRRFKNANGVYEADFINCIAWRQTADFVHNYFHKGDKIGVVGTLQTRSYEAQDGSKRFVTEVVAENVEFVQSKTGNGNGSSASQGYAAQPAAQQPKEQYHQTTMAENGFSEVDDDELPF